MLELQFTCSILLAVDECQLSNGGCDQICRTTIEGFECGCFDGYTLASDQLTCRGKHIG